MGMNMQNVPEKVQKFVLNETLIVNCVLLLFHISFGVFFYIYKAPILFYFNLVSILVYIICFEVLRRRQKGIYTFIVFAEIYIFMMLGVVCLGWNYGFQHYCIGFAASAVFSDYFVERSRSLKRRAIIIGGCNLAIYLVLRFWTYYTQPVYVPGNEFFQNLFYVGNTISGFGFMIMYIAIYSDTVHRMEQELFELAHKDHLTGLHNRRHMMRILRAFIEDEEKEKFAIAMMDVDYFKNVNDTYGHDAGDKVLKTMSEILKEESAGNASIMPCRWGGEEFLLALSDYNGNKEEIMASLEALRKRVEERIICHEEQEIRITVTVGVAFYESGLSLNELLKAADNKLYEGKEGGRNKVVW